MSLSHVPREIRHQIFDLVICSPVTPPASPSVSQEGRKRFSKSEFRGSGIWNLKPQNPALRLLLVNKQFYDEVQHVLQYVPTAYHLDIMFVKDHGLWPTWTIPALPRTQYIDSINASFRIFDPPDDLDSRFAHSLSFMRGCGGPELAIWSFYSLLTGVVERGPGFFGYENHYIVKEISINILSPTDGASHESIAFRVPGPANETKEGRRRRQRPTRFLFRDTDTTPEERLAIYMTDGLSTILHIGYHSMKYGMILWENVAETIAISINGKQYKRFDMEKLIEDHGIRWWGETPEFIVDRREKYRLWREWLDERRRGMKEGRELDNNPPVTYVM